VTETSRKFEEIRQARLTRTVTIHRVSKIAEGYWQVGFTTQDFAAGTTKISEDHWVASLTTSYEPREVNWEDRYMNPLGFIVTEYSVVADR
jgi:type IV secretory pathway component VirB8